MADFILHATLSNLLVSALLAAVAWIIQQRYQSATLANLLWVMVLLKMVTPPLFALPLLEVTSIAGHNSSSTLAAGMPTTLPQDSLSVTNGAGLPALTTQPAAEPVPWPAWFGSAWLVVSALLLVLSLVQILRFHAYLKRQLLPAPKSLLRLGRHVARQVGINRLPRIATTRANISPFVWWSGGRPLVVVPRLAIDGLSKDDLQMVLAHELIHLKRGDHYIRWLEWLTGLTLWWNPVLWVARRQLRTTEEIACDGLVIQSLRATPRNYAGSLLNMAELLTTSTTRPPSVASAINSGGTLEKRLTMILKPTTTKLSAWVTLTVVATAASLFPLGLVYAQDYEAIQKRLGQAVKSGEISRAEAGVMLQALKEAGKVRQEKTSPDKEYAQAVERLKAAVEAGKVTEDQAEQRLKMMAERLRERGQPKTERGVEAKKREYMAAAEKIEWMVKEGKVSKADAEKRLSQMRKKMFPERTTPELKIGVPATKEAEEIRKKRYMEGVRKMEAAVEAGEVSKEAANKRLSEMRKRMFPERATPELKVGVRLPTKATQEIQKKEYRAAEEKILEMVKAGKISKEDADKRLIEMRKKMFPKSKVDPQKSKDDSQEAGENDQSQPNNGRRRGLFRRGRG